MNRETTIFALIILIICFITAIVTSFLFIDIKDEHKVVVVNDVDEIKYDGDVIITNNGTYRCNSFKYHNNTVECETLESGVGYPLHVIVVLDMIPAIGVTICVSALFTLLREKNNN